ncbi:MAG: hypothetical protein HOH16_07085, partial [Planctomycetaceae bacterium]|nr:hypothetical protein [Planctomycetaceae bacterium]
GAFDDMGYGVNYDAAQPYSPPTTTVTTIGAGISNTLGRGISNAVATIPAVIPPTTITQTTISTSKRVLPARITFPDRPSIILSENNASRQMVRSALEINSGLHEGVIAFSLHHLSTKQRSILAAWASIGQETQSFTSSSMTSAGHGPRPGFFANEIFHIDVHGNLL